MSETAEKPMPERLARADFFRSEGRYDEAMRLANDHLNENYDDPRALFIVGNILIESGKVGLAHTLFKQFLGLKPNVPHAWNNLGRCYHDSAAMDEAERCFRRAYKMEPDNAISCCNLGLVYLFKGDLERAIEYSEKAIKITPDYRNAKHNLGLALQNPQPSVTPGVQLIKHKR
jgi:tetratricopeptide (TPR) repeat protein